MPAWVWEEGNPQGLPSVEHPPPKSESRPRTSERLGNGGRKREAGRCPSPPDAHPASLWLRPLGSSETSPPPTPKAAVRAETPQASQAQATLLHSELGPKSRWGSEPVPHLSAPKQDPSRRSRKAQSLGPSFLRGRFLCYLTSFLPPISYSPCLPLSHAFLRFTDYEERKGEATDRLEYDVDKAGEESGKANSVFFGITRSFWGKTSYHHHLDS